MPVNLAIMVKTSFIGFHRWVDAPNEVDYLRNYHRHVFHVELIKTVTHGNRDLEFHTLKNELDAYLRMHFQGKEFDLSCEQVAERLLGWFEADMVSVGEDGENYGIATRVPAQPVRSLSALQGIAARLAAKGPVKEGEVVTDEVTGQQFKVTSVVSSEQTFAGAPSPSEEASFKDPQPNAVVQDKRCPKGSPMDKLGRCECPMESDCPYRIVVSSHIKDDGSIKPRCPWTAPARSLSKPCLLEEGHSGPHCIKVNGARVLVKEDDPKPDAVVEENPCFVGVEAEGPHRGKPTLFVPGRTTPKQYLEARRKLGEVCPGWWKTWMVYYGAGGDRSLKPETLAQIFASSVTLGQITLEVDCLAALNKEVKEVITESRKTATPITVVSMTTSDSTHPDLSPWAKAVTGSRVVWYGRHGKFETHKNDPLFMFDQPISKFCSK